MEPLLPYLGIGGRHFGMASAFAFISTSLHQISCPLRPSLTLVRVPKNNHIKGFLGSILTPTWVLGSLLTPVDALKNMNE